MPSGNEPRQKSALGLRKLSASLCLIFTKGVKLWTTTTFTFVARRVPTRLSVTYSPMPLTLATTMNAATTLLLREIISRIDMRL